MPTHKANLQRLSITQLAELTGRTQSTVRRLLNDRGLEPAKTDGRTKFYRSRDALAALYGGTDASAENARLARAKAEAQEMANAVTRGEQLELAEQERILVGLVSGTVQRLRGVPTKAAPIAHAAETIAEVEEIIRQEIDEALRDLADEGASIDTRGPGEVAQSGRA